MAAILQHAHRVDPAALRLEPLLGRLVNYERSRPALRVWDLVTIEALLARPFAGGKQCQAVQVGGSKGKGTTCAFLAAFAERAGLRPGVFLSPHVDTLLERIRVGAEAIAVERLEERLRVVLAYAETHGLRATFFEAMTAAAVDEFAAAKVGLAIWEVGLGGRFDATTAIPVDCSIVTGIELEHTDVLGPTIVAIAGEKAPVIRANGRGFTAAQGAALAVIERHAASVGARLSVLSRDLRIEDERWDGEHCLGRLVLPNGRELPFQLPAARAYELPALALAAAAFVELCPDAALDLTPAPRPALPCRFEIVTLRGGEVVVLDGAHTEQSMSAVAVEMNRRWPRARVAVLFACAAGKRWRETLSRLLPIADSFVVTELSGTVGEIPSAIAEWLRLQGRECVLVSSAADGLVALMAQPGPRLVTGSFYLAGEVRRLLRTQ
jgi:dihydrofolate synthase/folylpolyglutamate synthase